MSKKPIDTLPTTDEQLVGSELEAWRLLSARGLARAYGEDELGIMTPINFRKNLHKSFSK